MTPLVTQYDAALFDLDGVVYLGPIAIPGVADALEELRARGTRVGFVTNNAARTPATVAAHLCDLGIEAREDDVVNSTQATVRMLQRELPAGARCLVVGTAALAEQLQAGGFTPVHDLDDDPVAVVQGYHPDIPWGLIEAAAIAVQRGARWFTTNPDLTRPTERGILPGCGAQVAVVRACVDVDPMTAGKPFRPLLDETVLRLGAERPVFVGDRIDTDIMGANAVGMDSLFVFTGAHGKRDLVAATEDGRPTHIGYDVASLLGEERAVELSAHHARCRSQRVEADHSRATLTTRPDGVEEQLDALWAALQLAWHEHCDIADVLDELDLLR